MTIAIRKYAALTELLLPLAEEFEAGNPRGIALELASTKEPELLKECLAELIADRWLTQCHSSNLYKLTEEGYQHFEPRLRALRVLR
jgi:hypothetical protein